MPIRYIIDAEPEQAEALSRVLGEISVSFDRQLNLCAMIQENELEQIFQGHDLEMLVEKANEYLEEEDHPLRFRRDLDQLDDLQAQYDFLMLMTMHSDWHDIYRDINEISSTEMEAFREKHPITMHLSQEKPAGLPARECVLTDLHAPIYPHPTLQDLLRETLRTVERKMAENMDMEDPESDDPVTDTSVVMEEVGGLRHILNELHKRWSPRQYMQDQFGDQLYSGAQRVLELLDAEDRDRLDEVVGRSLREYQAEQ